MNSPIQRKIFTILKLSANFLSKEQNVRFIIVSEADITPNLSNVSVLSQSQKLFIPFALFHSSPKCLMIIWLLFLKLVSFSYYIYKSIKIILIIFQINRPLIITDPRDGQLEFVSVVIQYVDNAASRTTRAKCLETMTNDSKASNHIVSYHNSSKSARLLITMKLKIQFRLTFD